jgi:hypothetical protein
MKHDYSVCWRCKRGIGISKNGILRPHTRRNKHRECIKCEGSRTNYRKKCD